MFKLIRAIFKYPKTNIYETIFIFVLFYKILNVFNFQFDDQMPGDGNDIKQSNTQKTVTILDRFKKLMSFDNLYFYAQLFLLVFAFYSVVKNGNFFHSPITIIAYGNYFYTVVANLFLLMICITSYFTKNNYVAIFRMFYEFDRRIAELKFPFNNNAEFLHILRHFVFHNAVLVILTIFMWQRNTLSYPEFFLRTVPYYSFIAVLGIFHAFLCFLEKRFLKLNKCFEFYFIKSKSQIDPTVDKYNIYYEINALYEHLNSTFDRYLRNMNFQAMFAIAMYVIFTGFTVFTTYLILAHHSYVLSDELFNIIFDVDFTILLIITISRSEAVTAQAKELAELVHAASHNEANKPALKHVDFFCFANQLSFRYPVASCGLFDFNWSLVFSVFASLCMYLIILIQFDNPKILKNN